MLAHELPEFTPFGSTRCVLATIRTSNPPGDQMSEPITRAGLAARIDHTLLRPEAPRADLDAAASSAAEWGCASVCVQPEHVAFVVGLLGGRLRVSSVVGFPHGATLPRIKAAEAAAVVAHGAAEVEMVVALGPIAEDDLGHVAHEVAVVREAVPDVVLKVILESALWTPAVLRDAAGAALDGGADLLKTSTGFHPAGGATVEAVRVLREVAGARAGVKASGGLRSLASCRAALDAGADRLGLSATAEVLAEFDR